MSTQVQPTATKEQPAKPQDKPRAVNVNLRSADGAQLLISLTPRKDGTWRTQATHSVRSGKKWAHQRGATETHATQEAGRAAQDKLVAQALKLGWVRRVWAGGFKAKPDVFDAGHIPAPAKAKK